ncbi:hypothetical protein SAMN04487992_106250 [Cellulophaga baltica]|jgi:hypothetical protein|uniref:Uncharacterized protein n=1 Tax=Cellulophaga baltica TaxID=76594 RepID=A0A1G7HSG7_9FLAO|nr:hypothetical protein SAMN04487992_106250 [Cellulophaga baltica]
MYIKEFTFIDAINAFFIAKNAILLSGSKKTIIGLFLTLKSSY